jgi:putative flippase GtrA
MRFFLYCACGGLGVFFDFILYFLCLNYGFSYQIANACGYLLGTCVSFILNRKLTFQVSDQVLRRFLIFLGVAIFGFLVSVFMLWLMVDICNISQEVAKFLTLPVVVGVQYTLNRRITFVG